MLKIRRPLGRLIFNMGIAIPGKTVFLIETAPRVPSQYKDGLSKYGISIIKMRWSWNCLIFIMGIPILIRWYLYTETTSSYLAGGYYDRQGIRHCRICRLVSPMAIIGYRQGMWELHPWEKVIGIFFRHKYFTIYFLLFVLIFIHNICEVVNIKSTDFCCISVIGYTSLKFWKGFWVKTRCHISLIYAGGKDDIETWEKRPVLVHSLSVGGSNESVTNYRKPVVTHKSTH